MKKSWFTLVELMIAIAIITFLLIWVVNIDFRSINDKQKLDIFSLKVIWEIETVRTNSLIWKWLWEDKEIPESWKIDFTNSNSWEIITSYNSSWTWVKYNNIFFDNFFEIKNISCSKIKNSSFNDISWTWTILFKWDEISLINDCNENQLIKIDLAYKNYNKEINFNSVNWLIKAK